MLRSIWEGRRPWLWTTIAFVLVGALGPAAAFFGAFLVLCAIECSALPWLTFVVGPALLLMAVLPATLWLGVGAFRATRQLAPASVMPAKVCIVSAIVWLPAASAAIVWLLLSSGAVS